MENIGIIYKITNNINDKIYIGMTTEINFERRMGDHSKSRNDVKFHRAIKKYGWENFEVIKLEENIPLSKLSEREIYWISKYNSFNDGYNSTTGGEGGNTYAKRTPKEMKETKNKISNALKGDKNGNKGQYIGKLNGMYGKTITDEHKQAISRFQKGRKKSEETKAKMSKSSKGKPKHYVNCHKYIYVLNLNKNQYSKMKAHEVKDKFKIKNYIKLQEIINDEIIIKDKYLIIESVETIEKQFQKMKLN